MEASSRDEIRQCDLCGYIELCKWGPDPFADEVNDDDTPMWLCENCIYESNRDLEAGNRL